MTNTGGFRGDFTGIGGYPTYGHAIGIIMLNCRFARIPGDMGNATTFPFPVLYHVVEGISVDQALNGAEESALLPFMEAARQLEARGVKAITTSCGCLARFQRQLARAVRVPLFASTLIQVPLIWEMLGRTGKIGILAADASLLAEGHFEAVGWSTAAIPIAMASMDKCTEFPKLMIQNDDDSLSIDFGKIETEVREAARAMRTDHPELRAIVIECTNLVPYASAVQQEARVPVFDIVTLTKMMHECTLRQPFHGYT